MKIWNGMYQLGIPVKTKHNEVATENQFDWHQYLGNNLGGNHNLFAYGCQWKRFLISIF